MAQKRSASRRYVKSLVFWGCEGKSEENYAVFLNRLFDRELIPFRLNAFNLGEAGSVAAKIHAAKKKLGNEKSKGSRFKKQFLVMDVDLIKDNPTKRSEAEKEALKHKITILWQRPCFEGFLIKHFEDEKDRNPPNCREAEIILKSLWPDYDKPESVQRLTKKLQLNPHVKSLLTVDPDFKKVFEEFGLRLK